MALLRQQYPFWTVEELKALAMNTALHDIRSGSAMTSTIYGPGRVGGCEHGTRGVGAVEVMDTKDGFDWKLKA